MSKKAPLYIILLVKIGWGIALGLISLKLCQVFLMSSVMINRLPTKLECFLASMCHLAPLIPLVIILRYFENGPSEYVKILFFLRLVFPILWWILGSKNDWMINQAKTCLNFQITYSFLFAIPLRMTWILVNDILGGGYSETNSPVDPVNGLNPVMAIMSAIGLLFLALEAFLFLFHIILVIRASIITLKAWVPQDNLIAPKTYLFSMTFFSTSDPVRAAKVLKQTDLKKHNRIAKRHDREF